MMDGSKGNNESGNDHEKKSKEKPVAFDLSVRAMLTFQNKEKEHSDYIPASKQGENSVSASNEKNRSSSIRQTSKLKKTESSKKHDEKFFSASSGVAGKKKPNSSASSQSNNSESDNDDSIPDDYSVHHPLTTAEGQMVQNPHYAYSVALLAAKREYNRRNAARARKRAKTQLRTLRQQVQTSNMAIAQLKERNVALRTTLQTLKEQNSMLIQNQQAMEGIKATTTNNMMFPYDSSTNFTPLALAPTNINHTPKSYNATNDAATTNAFLLQLVLAAAASSSSSSPMPQQQQQSQATLAQQQMLYYWLVSQMQHPQPQQPPPPPQYQYQATQAGPLPTNAQQQVNASEQLLAWIMSQASSLNGKVASSNGLSNNANETQTISNQPKDRLDGAQPPG
jgi:hypothetical protein